MADAKTGSAISGAAQGATTGAMVGGPWGAVIGGGIGLAGGLMGGAAASEEQERAQKILQEMYARYANLQIPDIEKQRLAFEEYRSSGNYDPAMESALGISEHDPMQDIQVDPRLRQAQMNQLETLSKLGETGFSPEERAQINSMQRKVEADNTSRLQQILQQQDMRGVGSSEAGLAARLQSSQSAANRQAQEQEQIAAQAWNRALQAKMGAGQLGGQIENTQFGQEAAKAGAQTNREMANFNNRNSVQQRNIASQNQGQMYNLQNNQNVMNQNVGMRNNQQQYNKELSQQQYNNELQKLSGMSGQVPNIANQHNQQAKQIGANYQNAAGGLQNIWGALNMAQPGAGTKPTAAKPTANAFSMQQADDDEDMYGKQLGKP